MYLIIFWIHLEYMILAMLYIKYVRDIYSLCLEYIENVSKCLFNVLYQARYV